MVYFVALLDEAITMRTAEFLSAYPRNLTKSQIHQGAKLREVQAAQLYSYSFGHIVFDALQGQRDDLPERLAQLNQYESEIDFGELEGKLLEDTDKNWRWRNEVNFHGLNYHMEKMWEPLIHGEWTDERGHQYAKNFSMNGLALSALWYYTFREKYVREHGVDALQAEGIDKIVSRLTGAMQETDGTIATLQWSKKYPNITVIPAPAQFEHSTSNANADLLVIDFENDKMAGVQIKTAASRKTQQRYDSDRIAVISSEELGNVRVFPPKKGKQAAKPKPWPGIIAASRVHAINTRNNPDFDQRFIPYLLRRKMEAASQLGTLRVDYRDAAEAIGRKVLEKL